MANNDFSSDIFDGESGEFMHGGRRFTWSVETDYTGRKPWEDCDGVGIVSEWAYRQKRPGERVLNADRGYFRFYDFAATIKVALAEGWGIENAPVIATKGQIAALAVERDYQMMRAFCNDEWGYLLLCVTDTVTGEAGNVGGLESFSRQYIVNDCAIDLAGELLASSKVSVSAEPIPRNPAFSDGAFTGQFYIVNTESGLAIESDDDAQKALSGCEYLNGHNAKVGAADRFKVVQYIGEAK